MKDALDAVFDELKAEVKNKAEELGAELLREVQQEGLRELVKLGDKFFNSRHSRRLLVNKKRGQ